MIYDIKKMKPELNIKEGVFYKDIEECYIQQNEIENQFKLLFGNDKM